MPQEDTSWVRQTTFDVPPGRRPDLYGPHDIEERRTELLRSALRSLTADDLAELRPLPNEQHPADLAEVLGHLQEPHLHRALQLPSRPLAADVVAELDPPAMRQVAHELDDEVFADLIELDMASAIVLSALLGTRHPAAVPPPGYRRRRRLGSADHHPQRRRITIHLLHDRRGARASLGAVGEGSG